MLLVYVQSLLSIVHKLSLSKRTVVLCCGFFLHLTYGSVFTFGNLTTYVTSYLRRKHPDITYSHTLWIQAVSFASAGISLPLGGYLETRLGPRWTTLLAILLMSGGVLLTSLSVQYSLALVIVTYGFVYGLGARLGYMAPIAAAMRHGLVSGVIVAGYGLGAFTFNLVQRYYVNPRNIPANAAGYFTDDEILDRIPSLFLLLGGTYLAVQLVALIFLSNPESEEKRDGITGDSSVSIRPDGEMFPDEPPLPVRRLLRSPLFYALWFTFLFMDQTIIVITGQYKAFGLMFPWLDDDAILTLIGSLGSVGSAVGRLGWGCLVDRYDYKTLMLILTLTVTALLLSFNGTPLAGVSLYGCWVVLINAVTPGIVMLLPKAVGNFFGRRNIALNYSLLFTSYLAGGPLAALVSNTFLHFFGWIGVFWSTAAFSAAAAVITWCLPDDP